MEDKKIYLNDILKNDDIALNNTIFYLKKRGWCFIRFSELFDTTIQNISFDINNFFKLNKETKEKYSYSHTIGYYELPFKQHFKILTGNYNLPDIKGINQKTKEESNMQNSVEKLSKLMDKLMLKLTLSPIFNISKKDTQYLSIFGNDKAGLLDIVSYAPNIDIKERPFYVNQHVDPGLFSLNIFSNASGMQFYDPETKLWYEMPYGYGAIFCGQAAKTLLNFTPAIHRVVNNGIGRMSIWYEVGVKSQLQPKNGILNVSNTNNEDIPDFNTPKINIPLVSINVEIEALDKYEKSKNITLYLPKNGTIIDIKKGIENDSSGGMPMSKVMPSLEVQQQKRKELDKIKKRVNLIKNLDDKKFGNIHYWKLTMDGYLMPSTPPKPLSQQIWL